MLKEIIFLAITDKVNYLKVLLIFEDEVNSHAGGRSV